MKPSKPSPRRAADADLWTKPGAQGERLVPTDTPTYLLARLSTALSRKYARDCTDVLGVSAPEARIVTLLGAGKALGFKELVESSAMDKAQASRTLSALVQDGYIALQGPTGPADRFASGVMASLTAKGERLRKRAVAILQGYQIELLAPLSDAERRALHRLLHRLLDVVDANPKPHA